MGAKYCKRKCSLNNGKACHIADDCSWHIWDVAKEKGYKPAPLRTPLEEDEQKELADWLNAKGILWVHIPNERKATAVAIANLERQGLKKGFPDNFIAEPCGGFHGLFIELKRAKKALSRVSPEQRQWIKDLNGKGFAACVCYGAEEAKRVVLEYLGEVK